jgi:hypothetical protein
MNKIIGWFLSKCTGLTPSRTPACGGALIGAVGAALADAAIEDMAGGSGIVVVQVKETQDTHPEKEVSREGRREKGLNNSEHARLTYI